MKNKFSKYLNQLDANNFENLSNEELKSIAGGANSGSNAAAGSQTSNTGSESFWCCDSTCVCKCLPIPLPPPSVL
ncbi:hypothetical protein BKI52_18960 [marine bacterium AO1-C]|nr:hypothetical protein BKI52_18960 [marine bacterium AO1-C]